jgi:protein O-mannosyl-transferase
MTLRCNSMVNDLSSVSTHRHQVLFAIISLAIMIPMIYINSLDCSWHFDDEHSITDNPNIHMEKLSWENLNKALHSDQNNPEKIYRPISNLSFALNYYFGELNVFGYHIVNISIHLITSIFLFLFTYYLLELPLIKDRYAGKSYFIAMIATVLWAINPLQGQAITYIVQRMASMAGMFYIISMYLYLKARTAETNNKRITFISLSALSFALALGSKENAILLPFSLILLELMVFQKTPWPNMKKHINLYLLGIAAFLLIALLYIFLKDINIFDSLFSGYQDRPFTLGQRLLTEPRVIILYISLLLYPVSTRLNIAHDIDISTSLFSPLSTITSILLIIGIINIVLYRHKRYPLIAFSVCFFFLNHIIESSFLNLELIFEHRNYIPSMFFFLPIAIGLSMLLDYYKSKKFMQYSIVAFIVLFLIGLGHGTFIRNFTWKNEKTLWIDAVEKSPNLSRAHNNLGKYYSDHGHNDDAFSEYMKALTSKWSSRKAESFSTYFNLGHLLSKRHEYEKAEDYYKKALQINPYFPGTYNNLATLCDRKGDTEQTYKYLKIAFNLSPDNPLTNLNLGLYCIKKKKPEKAIIYLNRAIGPDLLIQTQEYMGIAYKQMGRYGKAAICFKNVIDKDPSNPMNYLHLADTYLNTGQMDLALQQTDKALLLMLKDKTLFKGTLDNLTKKNDLKDILPSPTDIIPLIEESIADKTSELNLWKDYLEGIKKKRR